jgi:hypothetical protein
MLSPVYESRIITLPRILHTACLPPSSVCTPLFAARPRRALSPTIPLSSSPSPLHCTGTTASSAHAPPPTSTSPSPQTRHAYTCIHVRARRRHKPAAVARLSSLACSCPSSTGHPCPPLYPLAHSLPEAKANSPRPVCAPLRDLSTLCLHSSLLLMFPPACLPATSTPPARSSTVEAIARFPQQAAWSVRCSTPTSSGIHAALLGTRQIVNPTRTNPCLPEPWYSPSPIETFPHVISMLFNPTGCSCSCLMGSLLLSFYKYHY